MFLRNRFRWRYNSAQGLLLDQIATPAVAAYSQARRLRDGYTGALTRVRRAADNLEVDIPFATNTQTRTNLAVVQPDNLGGTTVAGVTMTTIGTGTEFGLPYIDVRWQGTATVVGFLQFASSTGATNRNSTAGWPSAQ